MHRPIPTVLEPDSRDVPEIDRCLLAPTVRPVLLSTPQPTRQIQIDSRVPRRRPERGPVPVVQPVVVVRELEADDREPRPRVAHVHPQRIEPAKVGAMEAVDRREETGVDPERRLAVDLPFRGARDLPGRVFRPLAEPPASFEVLDERRARVRAPAPARRGRREEQGERAVHPLMGPQASGPRKPARSPRTPVVTVIAARRPPRANPPGRAADHHRALVLVSGRAKRRRGADRAPAGAAEHLDPACFVGIPEKSEAPEMIILTRSKAQVGCASLAAETAASTRRRRPVVVDTRSFPRPASPSSISCAYHAPMKKKKG